MVESCSKLVLARQDTVEPLAWLATRVVLSATLLYLSLTSLRRLATAVTLAITVIRPLTVPTTSIPSRAKEVGRMDDRKTGAKTMDGSP